MRIESEGARSGAPLGDTKHSPRVSYTLSNRTHYVRAEKMSSLLFSLAQRCLLEEQAGSAWVQVHCHLTGDGDNLAIAIIDDGDQAGGPHAVETTAAA